VPKADVKLLSVYWFKEKPLR